MGITAMVRTGAMSIGPSITGLLAGSDHFWLAFVATGLCRIVYDIGLWVLFINVKVERRHDDEDADSVDDDAWNGLLSDTDSDILSEVDDESTVGRESKDSAVKAV